MSRTISSAMVTAAKAPILSPILMTQIGFATGVLYCWSGYGNVTWNGITFTGTGTLGKVETCTDTSDLSSQGTTFILEGVSSAMIALAIGQVQQGLTAKMWLGIMDATPALIADPTLIFSGLTDVCKIDDSGETCTISLTCENKLARLNTPSARRYTADDQAIDYLGDRGFDYVQSLQDQQVTFG